MKKLNIVILCFLIFIKSSFGQTYYDVMELDSLSNKTITPSGKIIFDKKDSIKLVVILKKYVPNAIIYNEIQSAFLTNPYIGVPTSAAQSNPTLTPYNISNISSGINQLSSIGGINVANFADGAAKFLVERFKQELSMAFFDKLKKQMNDKRYGDLKILFPETWKTLMTLDNDIYQYSIYLNTLREAFKKDLTNEFLNLESLLKQQKYQDFFNRQNPELGTILRTSLYLINGFSSGKHPGDVVAGLNPETQITLSTSNKALQKNIRSSITTIQLISKSLRSKSNTNYWIPADSARLLFENDLIAFKIYLGLIYQQAAGDKYNFIVGGATRSLQQILTSVAPQGTGINEYRNFIETFIDNADEINQSITTIKSKQKSEIDYNDYYKLFNTSLDLIEQAAAFVDLPYVNLDEEQRNSIKSNSGKLLFVARSAGDLYVDVRTKNYSSAILNTVNLLDTLLDFRVTYTLNDLETRLTYYERSLEANVQLNSLNSLKNNIKELVKNYSENPSKNIDNISSDLLSTGLDSVMSDIKKVIESKRILENVKNKGKVKELILKYGSFIAAVAQAENSDEVKKAIESAALPAGSYSIKQKSFWNVSFNGYMGYNWDFKGGLEKDNLYAKGIYAPLGISFSQGLCKNHRWTVTVFTSIIDVGAIAAYRLVDSMTDSLKQEVRLESVFSPGIQFFLSIPKTPVTFGAGWRSTPKLFYSGKNDFLTLPSKDVFTLSVLVDIPIFNIYNKPYKK